MGSFTSVEIFRLIIAAVVLGWLLLYMVYNQPPGGYSEEKIEECKTLQRIRINRNRK